MTMREKMEAAIAKKRAESSPSPPPPPTPPPSPPPQPKAQKKRKPPRVVDQRLDMEMPTHGRLPDGSKFEATYDHTSRRWTGTLTLTSGVVFTEGSGAVMKLLKKLDAKYRESLKGEEGGPCSS